MKIIFANGRQIYPFFRGGDGTTIKDLLSALTQKGVKCSAFGKIDSNAVSYTKKEISDRLQELKITKKEENSRIIFNTDIHNEMVLSKYFNDILKEKFKNQRPNIVLTQLEDSDQVIKIANDFKIPVVLYVHDTTPENHKSLQKKGISSIFFNSLYVKNFFKEYHHIKHEVVYPPIDLKNYFTANHNPKYVTMINPIKEKGLDLLPCIIKKMPDIPFQIVKGWKGVDESKFAHLDNVKIIKNTLNMMSVYRKTKIIIIPSQWDEPFCRIPIEAGVNKIPSIVSRVGGLPESVGQCGVLVDDYKNPQKWVQEIKKLFYDDKKILKLGNLAQDNSEKFDIKSNIKHIINVLGRISI